MFLNLVFLPCTEPDAAFESIISKTNRDRLNPERKMDVRFYDSQLYQKAGEVSMRTPAKPIGRGTAEQTISIQGRKFEWVGEIERWRSDRLTNSIMIHPNADHADTNGVIREINRIEANILSRGLAGRETIQFHIGGMQPEPKEPKVASSIDFNGKHIHVYSFSGSHDNPGNQSPGNASHIVAAKLAHLGCPLENVLLHEIGHLLEPLLQYNIPRMDRTFSKGMLECRALMEKISPQYIGKQYGDILEQVRTLNQALRCGQEFILVGPEREKVETIHFLGEWTTNTTREIAAECIREYYLKPCITNQEPAEEKTGWNEIDEFIHRLCREARITLKREPTELFPERRKIRQPRLVENIQDYFSP